MTRLLAGFATNMSRASVSIFLRSARQSHPDNTEICLITNRVEGIDDLLDETDAFAFHTPSTYSAQTGRAAKAMNRLLIHQMRLIRSAGFFRYAPEADPAYRTLIETWHHPHFARWPAILRLLGLHGHNYEAVFLSDVKDVAFQSNAFIDVQPDAVALYKESYSFENEFYNRDWVIKGYGQKAYEAMKDQLPICVGTIAGTTDKLISLLEEFVRYFARSPFRTVEQGVFNHGLQNDEFSTPVNLVDNFAGACATMAGDITDDALEISGERVLRRSDGAVMPVLHGYDRYQHFNDVIHRRFA